MTVDTSSYFDYLTTSSTTTTTSTDSDSSSATSISADDFLTLLLAEIEYQDPTEPVDNAEMVNQLTQYSQLSEMSEINDKMDTLTDAMSALSAVNGLDYIGKEVEADGSTVTVDGDDISTMYFTVDEDVESMTCNIYDSSGSIVNTYTFSDIEAGTSSFTWDGTDYDDEACDDGEYTMLFTAEDSNGDDVDVSTTTTGTVTGVSTTDDGILLTLEDGRTVYMADVTYATS